MTQHHLQADFVVVGGGLSGVCAALAAARNGAEVILLQDRSVLGGNASSEVKMHVVGADCHGTRPGARESGLIEELKLEDAARNPHRSYSQWDLLLYEKVVTEPNITLLLDTCCVGCRCENTGEGRRITAVRALRSSTEDEFTIEAPVFADCSGDGILGKSAGAEFTVGREARRQFGESLAIEAADRQTLGSSILFTARRHGAPQPFIAPAWIRKFHKHEFAHRPIKGYEYGYWWFEWGGQLDTLKDNAGIRHELLRIALGVWDYVKNSGDHPDSAHWALEWVGAVPGKRETRRFLGPHILTEQDVREGRIFADQVAYGGWWLDLHPPNGVDAIDEQPCVQHRFPHLYTIPLRCLYSRNIDNLFFAGRNISATHVAFASTRVMCTCAVMGQAVGTAAALTTARMREHRAASGPAGPAVRPGAERNAPAGIDPAAARGAGGTALLTAPPPAAALPSIASIFDETTTTQLQQLLLKDDAFLPGLRDHDEANLARQAHVSASSETRDGHARLVLDGITRELFPHLGVWADGGTHRWESAGLPAWLELSWRQPIAVSEIHVTFDSGLQRELILSASDAHTRKVVRGPQPELVSEYELLLDGVVVASVAGNHLRKRVHRLTQPITASRLRLAVKSAQGVPHARVFEVRVY